jgi:tRNA pseudouridine38-40 synthase
MCYLTLFFQKEKDAGVHALSNVCHVDVERISKRKPGEVVCMQKLLFL